MTAAQITQKATAIVTPLLVGLAITSAIAYGESRISETGNPVSVTIGAVTARGQAKKAPTALQLGVQVSSVTAYGEGRINETGNALAMAIGTAVPHGCATASPAPLALAMGLGPTTALGEGEEDPPAVGGGGGGFSNAPRPQATRVDRPRLHVAAIASCSPLEVAVAVGDVVAIGKHTLTPAPAQLSTTAFAAPDPAAARTSGLTDELALVLLEAA